MSHFWASSSGRPGMLTHADLRNPPRASASVCLGSSAIAAPSPGFIPPASRRHASLIRGSPPWFVLRARNLVLGEASSDPAKQRVSPPAGRQLCTRQ
ncbi:hypothetical protein P170DRAFT_435648 [Aspergillus steynii IBT 23096]|uniref:Uncharacterized protein n=1 Tax=Aspergillus steynii IBT 23096 TaxID=1392250 RepID=A0A2I2GC39_9EURO|nr:uncharacterized protein P170DRAFT_435648 [Aspergillus steynii IBT 23096]PLB50458.1 hypothetical protein P170DRAFT_435648 [Aspergillus steynii IBT 23096]